LSEKKNEKNFEKMARYGYTLNLLQIARVKRYSVKMRAGAIVMTKTSLNLASQGAKMRKTLLNKHVRMKKKLDQKQLILKSS
jgi:hypothetical protein